MRYRRFAPLFLAGLSSLALVASMAHAAAGQQQPKLDLRGVVVDRSTGAPIAGAFVEVNGGPHIITDREGRFRARGVRAGAVHFRAGQLGYAELSESRELNADSAVSRLELEPNPVMLRAIEVISDRLRSRRNSIPYSVRAYDVGQLAMGAHWDAFEFVRSRTFAISCAPDVHGSWCIRRRGGWVRPQVYVDESRYFGGLDVLQGWPVDDLYLVEVLAGGTQVRIYTKRFAQLLASGRVRLSPVLFY